jgi:hypothetical protein
VSEEVHVTRVFERHACFFVEGKVLKNGRWLDAAFTAFKGDVAHMNRDEFHEFCKRQLPNVTSDINWEAMAHV